MTARERLERHRDLWDVVNREITDRGAADRWSDEQLRWGLFAVPDDRLGVVGDVAGLDVVELACGTAFLGAALARRGARVVGLDLSRPQLLTAQRCQRQIGPTFPLVEGDGGVLPLRDGAVDLVVSEYGAAPWCDPSAWLPEAARVLRPGGRLVFLTHSPLVAMCVPEEGGVAGDRLLRGPADLSPVRWPGGGVEFHPSHSEWVGHLGAAGFAVEALHELMAPLGAAEPEWYEIVGATWASRWPAEDLWVARRRT